MFASINLMCNFTSTNNNNMKKSIKNTKKIELPAHLQIIADRWNSNYKNVASDYAQKISFTITDVTPAGYGN